MNNKMIIQIGVLIGGIVGGVVIGLVATILTKDSRLGIITGMLASLILSNKSI